MVGWIAFAAALCALLLGGLGWRKGLRAHLPRFQSVLMWSVAVLVGAASAIVLSYPLDDRTRVYGFPLPAAVFQRNESGRWEDFVGPLTTPFMLVNALVNTGVVAYVWSALLTRRVHTKRSEPPTPVA